jgi:hypothetical protein
MPEPLLGCCWQPLVLLLLKIAWPFVSSLVLATMVATVVYPAYAVAEGTLRLAPMPKATPIYKG